MVPPGELAERHIDCLILINGDKPPNHHGSLHSNDREVLIRCSARIDMKTWPVWSTMVIGDGSRSVENLLRRLILKSSNSRWTH